MTVYFDVIVHLTDRTTIKLQLTQEAIDWYRRNGFKVEISGSTTVQKPPEIIRTPVIPPVTVPVIPPVTTVPIGSNNYIVIVQTRCKNIRTVMNPITFTSWESANKNHVLSKVFFGGSPNIPNSLTYSTSGRTSAQADFTLRKREIEACYAGLPVIPPTTIPPVSIPPVSIPPVSIPPITQGNDIISKYVVPLFIVGVAGSVLLPSSNNNNKHRHKRSKK